MTWPNFPFNFIVIPAIMIWIAWTSRRNLKIGLLPWYKELKKPKWTPSGKLIGEVWVFIYVITGLAVMWFWDVPAFNWHQLFVGLILLGVVYLHYSWHRTLFVRHDMKKAHSLLQKLLYAAVLAIILIFIRSPIAAFLFIPYVAWMGSAFLWSREILQLNSAEKK
jgi:translocator protein